MSLQSFSASARQLPTSTRRNSSTATFNIDGIDAGIWVDVAAAVTYIAARNQFSVCLATLPFYGAQPAPQKLDDRPRDARVIGYTDAMQGGHDGHRYREVLQYSKRLWIHRTERRQQGRVRAHQRGRARRHAHPHGRPEGQLRHRDRAGQAGGGQSASRVTDAWIGPDLLK